MGFFVLPCLFAGRFLRRKNTLRLYERRAAKVISPHLKCGYCGAVMILFRIIPLTAGFRRSSRCRFFFRLANRPRVLKVKVKTAFTPLSCNHIIPQIQFQCFFYNRIFEKPFGLFVLLFYFQFVSAAITCDFFDHSTGEHILGCFCQL